MKSEPWLVPSCIEFLDSILTPESVVFEWGMGGSTLWLDKRCKRGWSVEHNWDWFNKVSGKVQNITLVMCKPLRDGKVGDASDPDACRSSCIDGDFSQYVSIVDDKEPDVVLVDGRARASCIKRASFELKIGGWLVVDNTCRDWYLEKAGKYLEGWDRKTFYDGLWETSFWRKPDER